MSRNHRDAPVVEHAENEEPLLVLAESVKAARTQPAVRLRSLVQRPLLDPRQPRGIWHGQEGLPPPSLFDFVVEVLRESRDVVPDAGHSGLPVRGQFAVFVVRGGSHPCPGSFDKAHGVVFVDLEPFAVLRDFTTGGYILFTLFCTANACEFAALVP